MSAYVCEDSHFIRLAAYAVAKFVPECTGEISRALRSRSPLPTDPAALATKLARILQGQNVRSVNYRYAERRRYPPVTVRPEDIDMARRIQRSHVYKSAACLAYQSCETRDWEKTAAFRFLEFLKAHSAGVLLDAPGAEWGPPPQPGGFLLTARRA